MMWDDLARRAFGLAGSDIEEMPPAERSANGRLKLGLALGGGAARGWAHIGVMRVLQREGIVPDVIAGSSVGAVVGGCTVMGKLDELEAFTRSLTRRRVMGLLDFHISGSGLIGGDRLRRLLERDLGDTRVEDMPIRFVTIATELGTGHEIWLTRGPLVKAMRASYALPGILDPVRFGRRWLMDGALVNPIPVTAARALGADIVVCVNLNSDIRLRGTVIQSHGLDEVADAVGPAVEGRRWGLFGRDGAPRPPSRASDAPGIAAVMIDAFNITQDRIARARLAGDPPDVMIAPKLASIGLFEFHRAADCIELGQAAAERALPDIQEAIRHAGEIGA